MAHKISIREQSQALLDSRLRLVSGLPLQPRSPEAAEGGCGVLGFAASLPVAGRHVVTASQQMHNRGNGKGGGIAAAGLDPAQMGVTPEVLRSHYLIQIAYLDPRARAEVETRMPAGALRPGRGVPGRDAGRGRRGRWAGGAPAGGGALLCPGQAGGAGALRRGERAAPPAGAPGGRRVRLPEQLPPQPALLLQPGR